MTNQPYPLELKGNQLFVDNSSLSTITACPRKAAYGVLLKQQLAKPRAALTFGSALHKALETRDRAQQIMCTHEIEEKMIEALVDFYSEQEESDDYRNLAYAIKSIQAYNKTWQADTQVAITLPDGEVAVELPFAFSLGFIEVNAEIWVKDLDVEDGLPYLKYVDQIEVIFTGKIDRVCRKLGGIFVFDHKSTSMGGPTFFDEFFTSHQFRGYKWACQQLFPEKVIGVTINALVCRPPLKSGDVNYTFDRQDIIITDDHVEEWQHSFMTIIQTFLGYHIEQAADPESVMDNSIVYPMHTNSCITKYGACEFFSVCQLTPSNRNAMLYSNNFQHNDWDPLKEGHSKQKVAEKEEDFQIPGFWEAVRSAKQ